MIRIEFDDGTHDLYLVHGTYNDVRYQGSWLEIDVQPGDRGGIWGDPHRIAIPVHRVRNVLFATEEPS